MPKLKNVYFQQFTLSKKFEGFAYWYNPIINPDGNPKKEYSIMNKKGESVSKFMDERLFVEFTNNESGTIAEHIIDFCESQALLIREFIIYDHTRGSSDSRSCSGGQWSTNNRGCFTKRLSDDPQLIVDQLWDLNDSETHMYRATVRYEPYVLSMNTFQSLYEQARKHLFDKINAEYNGYVEKMNSALNSGDMALYQQLSKQIAGTEHLTSVDDIPATYDPTNRYCQHIFSGSSALLRKWTKDNMASLEDSGSIQWRVAIDLDYVRIAPDDITE